MYSLNLSPRFFLSDASKAKFYPQCQDRSLSQYGTLARARAILAQHWVVVVPTSRAGLGCMCERLDMTHPDTPSIWSRKHSQKTVRDSASQEAVRWFASLDKKKQNIQDKNNTMHYQPIFFKRPTASTPAHTGHWSSVVLMLVQRLRRWPSIETTLFQCLVFPWISHYISGLCSATPANTRHWTNVAVMLGQRRRRWPNITATNYSMLCLLYITYVNITLGCIHISSWSGWF